MLVLAIGLGAGAQETDEAISETKDTRPPETELFLDQPDETAVPEEEEAGPELPGINLGDFARMILVLGLVIALIYGFFWILKRFSGVKAEGKDVIGLISTRPLKGDAALHLIEVGSRMFLVGSCGNSVNLVSEIDDKESVDSIRLQASQAPQAVRGGFSKMFNDRFGRVSPPVNVPEVSVEDSETDPASYLRQQRERLKDL